MKRSILSLVLAALLAACACLPAVAEGLPEIQWDERQVTRPEAATVEGMTAPGGATVTAVTLDGDVVFNGRTDSLGYKAEGSDRYALIGADGQLLTDAIYSAMQTVYRNDWFIVNLADADPVRSQGAIDGSGRVMIPAQYAKVIILSDRWTVGEHARASADGDSVDFFACDRDSGVRQRYTISGADFYYRGELAGTLDEASYVSGEVNAYGDYLSVRNADGRIVYYNRTMTPSSYQKEDGYPTEYSVEYDGGTQKITHTGSNKPAFVPGCDLSPDEVDDALRFDYSNGVVLNLQGEAVYQAQEDDSVYISRRYGDYFLFHRNDRYGLMDLNGNIVLPAEYDDIGEYTDDPLFRFGYVLVERDHRFGFLDAQGNVSCPLIYNSNYDHRWADTNSFAGMQNLDGTYTVISAAVGELPEVFLDMQYPSGDPDVICVERLDESWAVLDLQGQTVLQVPNAGWMSVNVTGTLALATVKNEGQDQEPKYNYTLFHIHR